MPYRYRKPSVKIFGTTIRKNKKGFSLSSKTLFGGRKTYNTATGKTTRTYKTGIKGLSYYTVSGGKKKAAGSRRAANKIASSGSGCCVYIIGVLCLLTAIILGVVWYIF